MKLMAMLTMAVLGFGACGGGGDPCKQVAEKAEAACKMGIEKQKLEGEASTKFVDDCKKVWADAAKSGDKELCAGMIEALK